jgi:hypothetical protein
MAARPVRPVAVGVGVGVAVMFNYFGSKARLAPTYQAPQHDLIIEPFAGAAGYSMYWLQERSDLRAVLIDIEPAVVKAWHTLLALSPDELWDYPCPRQGDMSQDLVVASSKAHEHLLKTALNKPFQVTEWMAQEFPMIRRRMAATLAKVQGRVDVKLGEYADAPNTVATWFIDPPYQREGFRYASGNRLDFQLLGEWSQSRQGQVIACDTMGADWLPFEPHRANNTLGGTTSIEAVWYSHPEPTLFSEVSA